MIIDFFFFKQKTAYEMRISDWSSDVCSSDLLIAGVPPQTEGQHRDGCSQCGRRHKPASCHAVPGRTGCTTVCRRGERCDCCRHWRCARLQQCGQEIGRASCRERVCPYV